MPPLFQLLSVALLGGGVLYPITLTAVALASVFARKPTRRRDARQTLSILLLRRPTDGPSDRPPASPPTPFPP